jgi:hypothetical protein
MSRDEQERLRDIKDAISAIRDHLASANETSVAKEDPLLPRSARAEGPTRPDHRRA